MSARGLTVMCGVALASCAALLGLPDPVLDETIVGTESGGGDVGTTPGDAADERRCDPTQSFGTPTPLPFGSFGRPSDDERMMFFSGNESVEAGVQNYQIRVRVASLAVGSLGPGAILPGDVNTAGYEARAALTPDLVDLYYEEGPSDGGVTAVARAVRTGNAWMAQAVCKH